MDTTTGELGETGPGQHVGVGVGDATTAVGRVGLLGPDALLRAEGVAAFAAATAAYYLLGGPLWLYLLLALAPDLSMVGYLAGTRVGSAAYNAAHTYVAPLALAAAGLWVGTDLLVLGALVWAAHVGVDRAVGYGLKYPTGFGDTHLGRVGGGR